MVTVNRLIGRVLAATLSREELDCVYGGQGPKVMFTYSGSPRSVDDVEPGNDPEPISTLEN